MNTWVIKATKIVDHAKSKSSDEFFRIRRGVFNATIFITADEIETAIENAKAYLGNDFEINGVYLDESNRLPCPY